MLHRSLVIFILLFTVCSTVMGQITCQGMVSSSEVNTALPFVNIGIKGKNVGAISQSDGKFSIVIPLSYENDTLTFSMVGYEELSLPIKRIHQEKLQVFRLIQKTTMMNTVSISTGKLVERSFGIKKSRTLIHLLDGSMNQNDIFEIAQLIKSDTGLSKITSVNLFINQPRKDSGTFRINFYALENNLPGERLFEKSIVQTKKIQEGWMKFDLNEYGVYLKGEFVVALEFIPSGKRNVPIYYELKLGGSSKSFVRTSSQGDWSVPPHHYRLYITALVADDHRNKKVEDVEEQETTPDTVLYSKSVKDSFSIFIHVPGNYNKRKFRNFPVVYLLDANVYFDQISTMIHESETDAIVVSIGYRDFIEMDSLRNRDYTFPPVLNQVGFTASGGADSFLKFIKEELMPYINVAYAVDTSNQTLMGHSLGGYFVLYTLLESFRNNNCGFRNYIAASPSLDYADKYLLNQFQDLTVHVVGQKKLLVTFGGKEDGEDGGSETIGMDNFKILTGCLSGKEDSGLTITDVVFPTFRHMDTAIPTFGKAMLEMVRRE